MKKLHVNLFLLIVCLVSLLGAQERSLFILHTNNTNGALENCYCPDHPLGALEKRVVFVDSFRQEHPNTILVDAGDLFTVVKRDFKDSLVVEAYRLLGYDAILPGDQEITRDFEEVNQLLAITGATIVGTNLPAEAIEGMVSYKLMEQDGIRIAILGIMDIYAFKYYPTKVRERTTLQGPRKLLESTLKFLQGKADVIIVLTHEGMDLDETLARQVGGIDLIVGSHSQSLLTEPKEVNGTMIVQAGKEGYYVGVVELKLEGTTVAAISGHVEAMTQDRPDDPRVMKMITEYEQRTGRINRRKLKLQQEQGGTTD
ncbi:MAG: hypothetical protein ACE5D2_04110 [Fidelibacterota bacterium]